MLHFTVRRLVWMIPVLFVVALTTFFLMHLIPGSPWSGGRIDAATISTLDRQFGLNKPVWQQFVAYLVGEVDAEGQFKCGVVCGNLGPSFRQRGRSTQDVLFSPVEGYGFWHSRFGYSLRLGLLALLFTVGAGLPLGVTAALRHGTWPDYAITGLTAIGASIPNFVLGLLLLVVLGSTLHWIPIVPRSWIEAGPRIWITPAIVLGYRPMSIVARLTRAAMLDILRQDYVRTARAKGLSESLVVNRHVLRNALIAVVTVLGPGLAELITGAFIVEMMFSFPGIGREYVEAVSELDYSMIMAATLLYAIMVAVLNLAVDVAYGLIDPRLAAQSPAAAPPD